MRRIAFLTLAEQGDFVIDDERAVAPLAERGIAVETIPWNQPGVDWRRYDLVVIRSTWDYQHHGLAFLETLDAIEAATRLHNSAAITRWNMAKTYLKDLAERGVPTVPTIWRDGLSRGGLLMLFDELGSQEAVIKPVMSGNAEGAWRLDCEHAHDLAGVIEAYFHKRPLMMQAFERAIVEEGEFSLMYFDGEFSHAIRKRPRAGDFRVQEEHGAEILAVTPEPALRTTADAAMAALGERLLYGRADLVRHGDGFRLMELELVEPALYLRMDPNAPARFADAVARLLA
jgi:glutathione synthase/RimK-type ligase-like ATP-grasp enzyme